MHDEWIDNHYRIEHEDQLIHFQEDNQGHLMNYN